MARLRSVVPMLFRSGRVLPSATPYRQSGHEHLLSSLLSSPFGSLGFTHFGGIFGFGGGRGSEAAFPPRLTRVHVQFIYKKNARLQLLILNHLRSKKWSRWSGLNRLPRPYQGRALPFELQRPKGLKARDLDMVDREGFEPSYLARRDRFTVCWL